MYNIKGHSEIILLVGEDGVVLVDHFESGGGYPDLVKI